MRASLLPGKWSEQLADSDGREVFFSCILDTFSVWTFKYTLHLDMPVFKRIYLIYLKGSITERQRQRGRDLFSTSSLTKWPQQLELHQSKTRSFFQVSYMNAGFHGQEHSQGTWLEVEQPAQNNAYLESPHCKQWLHLLYHGTGPSGCKFCSDSSLSSELQYKIMDTSSSNSILRIYFML